jgi:hypothetical protein
LLSELEELVEDDDDADSASDRILSFLTGEELCWEILFCNVVTALRWVPAGGAEELLCELLSEPFS